jgi:hypothetical protein
VVVGSLVGSGVYRREGTTFMALSVQRDSIQAGGGDASLWYETTDCTGTPYLKHQGGDLVVQARAPLGSTNPPSTLVYPAEPIQVRTLRSMSENPPDCLPLSVPMPDLVGTVGTLDVSVFIPPFRVK